MQLFTENRANGLRELIETRDDARASEYDLPMLEFVPTPTLANQHERGASLPNFPSEFDVERIRVGLHIVTVPVAVVFISDDYFTVH